MSEWLPPDPEDRLVDPPTGPAVPDAEWHRLDPRMLLVGPVSALRQFALPAVIGLVGLSSSQGGIPWWAPLVLLGVLAAGLLPWLTTTYRFTDTQFQRRSGLLSRKQLTAPLDRVRSVDLESSLLHRILGLTKVEIGTGVDETKIELDALGRDRAEALRVALLSRARSSMPRTAPEPAERADGGEREGMADEPPQVLAELDWSWLRFAPLNLARLVVVAAAFGFLGQFVDEIPVLTTDRLRSGWEQVSAVAIPLLVLMVALAALVGWLLLSVIGYVLQWSGMRLTRDADTLRLQAGLLTTRSTSVEEKRVRGVQLTEPTLMRLARGAELSTLATGVGTGGTTSVMPPSPLSENQRVAGLILGDEEPLHVTTLRHGPAARRRILLRRQWWTLTLTALAVPLLWWLDRPWWLLAVVAGVLAVLNVLIGLATYRHLGHAVTPGHLVSTGGALATVRTVLERDGVIGWVVSETIFQRRVGLVTLTATTAAGSEHVVIHDVPRATAVEVTSTVTPTAVGDFLVPQPG